MYLDDDLLSLLPWLRPFVRPISLTPSRPSSSSIVRRVTALPGYCVRQVDDISTAIYSAALARMVHSREKGGKKGLKKKKEKMQAEDVKFSDPGTKGVTVILFGWAGCKDRYLTKYSAIYEKAGYTTIRFTMPIVQVRGYFSYKLYAKQFYERVFADGTLKPEQIVWHVFSMNGCSMFTALWGLLQKVKRDDLIRSSKGVIFDSSPAFVRPDQSARAISMSSLPAPDFHPAVRETYRGILLLYFASHHAMVWLRSHIESRIWEKNFSYFHLQEMEMPKNSLYIYSEADQICTADSIEKIIEFETKKEGTQVHSLKLPESPHCAHLRTHPDTYAASCLRFVAEQDATETSLPPALTVPYYKLHQPNESRQVADHTTTAPEIAQEAQPEPDRLIAPPTLVKAVAAN